MPNICLGNLLPSSVLAYDNIDLIPNGFIPEEGTVASPKTHNQGGVIISERDKIRLLPSDRLYAEFWFGVSSRITGTNLADQGQGAFAALGFLGAGGGANIGFALGCTLIGDSERTISKWVFHVCDAETRLNRVHVLTKEEIASQTITLPDYVIGFLGITREPIAFVTPTNPLTPEQIDEAKKKTDDEVQAKLGKRVAPSQLTESDMRVLLGIQDLNELENLGNTHRSIRGWTTNAKGQIQATFKNYSWSDATNHFDSIVRDERKNRYRADNEFDRDKGHVFWNGNTDDLTDKKIRFVLSNEDPNAVGPPNLLKEGDKVYLSYSAAINPIFRHATANITNFFLFPSQDAYQLPPLDLVKEWNFKKFAFKVRKDPTRRAALSDIANDAAVEKEITAAQNDASLTGPEKERKIAQFRTRILLDQIESQRLIESKLEKANRNPIIKGCYFADSRGLLFLDFKESNQPELLVPRSAIADQAWFDSFIEELALTGAMDDNGQLNLSNANNTFFDDFLFDVSDHVNMIHYDNEKFGYERRFAKAISRCSVFNKNTTGTGVGAPNLDFVKNKTVGRDDYDLTSAKFDSVPMQGTAHLFSCNVTFVYDLGFCNKGTISADMILRTPTFIAPMTKKTRIYVEQFSAQYALRKDGAIWVGTKPAFQENYGVTTDPKRDFGFVVYPDTANGVTKYRAFDNGTLNKELSELSYKLPSTGHSLPPIDDSLTEESIKRGGYDHLLGDQPGYFKGSEITTEDAQILMNKVSPSIVSVDKLPLIKSNETGRLSINGKPDRRIRKITITYYPNSADFLDNKERLLSFVFPNSKVVVDNIGVPYQGLLSSTPRKITANVRYVNDETWFIDGSILKNMEILSVEAESISEEDYAKYKIGASVVSTCFDPSGNWLIFYEDSKGNEGSTINNGFNADGSHLQGPLERNLPGLSDSAATEISCLFSSDYGSTWFDFKAIVRTVAGETVGAPYAFVDYFTRKVHLFFVLNNTLMHKLIDTSLFDCEDAFLGYKRPLRFDQTTEKGYGLYHFTPGGQTIREATSSIVVGNLNGDYLENEVEISKEMKKQGRTDARIISAGDYTNYQEGFAEIDYFAFKDGAGQLKVMFVSNGKLYCRNSSNDGDSWFDVIPNGMYVHKNNSLQELKPISTLGVVLDIKKEFSYLTYQSEGMLFMRKFESSISQSTDTKIADVLSPDSKIAKPMFVVGALSQEAKLSIKNKDTAIVFPYSDVDLFGDAFSISETPSLGYMTASGILRFFYKDAAGNFRAFSFYNTPKMDIGYGNSN